jgi:hypothetical protein
MDGYRLTRATDPAWPHLAVLSREELDEVLRAGTELRERERHAEEQAELDRIAQAVEDGTATAEDAAWLVARLRARTTKVVTRRIHTIRFADPEPVGAST